MSDQYKHLVIIPTLALESTLMRTFGAFYKYSESNTLFVVSVNPHKMEDAKKNIEALKGLIGAQALLSPKENVTIEYVWSDEPIGFGAAVNKGYEFAKENYGIPEYITIANDDLHVTPGWMESLAGITDTISFSSSSLGITVKDFDTVTSIACDATLVSSGSTIEVKYFGKGGGSASSEYAVVSGWPCFINRPLGNSISTQDYRVDSFGSFQTEKPLIFMAYDESFTPAVSDFIVDADTNEKYFVLGVQYIQYSVGYENYWRIIMEMR